MKDTTKLKGVQYNCSGDITTDTNPQSMPTNPSTREGSMKIGERNARKPKSFDGAVD